MLSLSDRRDIAGVKEYVMYYFEPETQIQVNPHYYTAEVIERIKDFIDGDVVCVNKHKSSIIAVVLTGGNSMSLLAHGKIRSFISTKLDPAPWAETGEWKA